MGVYMANPATHFIFKILRKPAMAVLVATLALAAFGLWIFVREQAGFDEHLHRMSSDNESALAESRRALAVVRTDRQNTASELEAQQRRIVQADKVLKSLAELEPGFIDRMLGGAEEWKNHQSRVARTEAIKADAQTRVVELQRQLVVLAGREVSAEERVTALEAESRQLATDGNPVVHYARLAWNEAEWLFWTVFAAYLCGGWFVAVLLYFFWAPCVARGAALRLSSADTALPVVGASARVVEEALWPGEVLRVRTRFLSSAEDGLRRRRCLLLDWRRPFSCVASGLTGLVELRNERSAGERAVILACGDDPFAELAVVSVPEGGAFVLRAGFLMGIITRDSGAVRIRRYLRLFHWQSWVSGRFGYWEFSGPCRIVVSCVSALESTVMRAAEGGESTGCRTAQAGIVGFTPQLAIRPSRTQGFWRFYRGDGPLFEADISGVGAFLSSESNGLARARMRGNDGPAGKLLKIIGL